MESGLFFSVTLLTMTYKKKKKKTTEGEGNGNLLQCSFLENPMDRGAWQAIVCGVARVRYDLATKLSYN